MSSHKYMVNKFEAIGIGISILAMAGALFLTRFSTVPFISQAGVQVEDQSAALVVAGGNDTQSLRKALLDGGADSGKIQKMIVNDVVVGTGREAKTGDMVEVHYIGSLQSNQQQFDNSYQRGTPFSFTLGEGKVIPGWEKGVLGMKEGGKRILVIPSDLAYGKDGYGPIPADATLIFAIELLAINN